MFLNLCHPVELFMFACNTEGIGSLKWTTRAL